uniref:Chitin-binding type-2 domain-containing protein n=1 Tax=Globodera pallida TaxID=36090 RepID=A0A183C493_GLOPA
MERFNKESAYTTDCQKWGTFGFLKDREQCQTYRCLDERGSDIFIVNSCANYKKCFDEELDPICAKEGGRPAECQFCLTSLCNKVEPLTVVMAPRSSPSPLTPFVAPPYIVFKASIEKGGGVMSLCNFTFTFMLFLGGVLIRWMMEM